jgi:hypothetical protein
LEYTELLDEHLSYLKAQFGTVPLSQLADYFKKEAPFPAGRVIITFNDGWRSNCELLPVIERHSAPVTIFLLSGMVGTNRRIWNSEGAGKGPLFGGFILVLLMNCLKFRVHLNMNIVYINSCVRSGSSLLSLMIADTFGGCLLGETHHTFSMVKENQGCTCGEQIQDCFFWQPVLSEIGELNETKQTSKLGKWPILLASTIKLNTRKTAHYFGNLLPQLKNELNAAEEILRIYAAVEKVHKPGFIVDSSKFIPLFLILNDFLGNRLKVVWLVRDGRAVTSSIMRRTGQDVGTAARLWKRFNMNCERAHQRSLTVDKLFVIRYEDMVLGFNKEMARFGLFLGAPKERFAKRPVSQLSDFHFLGGSPTLRAKDRIVLRLDDRWRNDMSSTDLDAFERIAGDYNRKLGYYD